MSKKVEQLTISRFKGATCRAELEFDKNKSAVLIFGENGTGKSTIVDAMDFVCNGHLGSIEDKSVPGRKYNYLASLGQSNTAIDIQLSYGGQQWRAVLGHNNQPHIQGPDERPTANILRRTHILRLVNAPANDRYKALASFISVPNCERSEQALRDAARHVNDDYNNSVRAVDDANETLERLWHAEGNPGISHLDWAKEKAKASTEALQKYVVYLESLVPAIGTCSTAFGELTHSEGELEKAQQAVAEAELAFEQEQVESEPVDKNLITLLEEAKDYVSKHVSSDVCPVCEQDIVGADLLQRLDHRLSEMDKPRAVKAKIDSATLAQKSKQAILETRRKDFVAEARKLFSLVNDERFFKSSGIAVGQLNYERLLQKADESIDDGHLAEAKAFLEKMQPHHQPLEQTLDSKRKDLNQLNDLKTHVQTITEKSARAGQLEKMATELEGLLKIVEAERKSFVQQMLKEISDEVAKMYEKLHPDEGFGQVKMYLKPNVRGSLELEAGFQGRDVPPQAYYSDSHLDTLGVCVFLALAKHRNEEDTIIVLDDVITSVDQVHMERFIQLLHDEAANFNQLIVTTHYRPWRDRYKYASGPTANIQLIELLHWSLPRGIRAEKSKFSVEELQDYLAKTPLDRQIVASKSGILLEGLLDYIALRYRCKLPRQAEPNYTIGDLFDSLTRKLKQQLKVEKTASDGSTTEIWLESMLTQLDSLTWLRNQVGCHFNVTGMHISDTEVQSFGQQTTDFATALICDDCGQLPYRNKSGSYWECRCGNAKLFPLQLPG